MNILTSSIRWHLKSKKDGNEAIEHYQKLFAECGRAIANVARGRGNERWLFWSICVDTFIFFYFRSDICSINWEKRLNLRNSLKHKLRSFWVPEIYPTLHHSWIKQRNYSQHSFHACDENSCVTRNGRSSPRPPATFVNKEGQNASTHGGQRSEETGKSEIKEWLMSLWR